MTLFRSLEVSASGLTAERLRMDIIADNIANVNTTRQADGQIKPYQRKVPVFASRNGFPAFDDYLRNSTEGGFTGAGVRVVRIAEDNSPPRMVYNPGHPDANQEGYVAMPNINIVTEMADMISASRAYEANVTVVNTVKSMALKALEIGR